ncbi:site-specific integrase [Mycolicibacterium sp. S3B2]|uniref:site-specific integrase n=1 Tax=Mycolicibacterium sp. S3B2 TaxID=3415120 RepID=UPI003C7D7BF5
MDFEKRTISVEANYVTVGKQDYEGTPKSRASRRVLPMPDEVYDLLLDAKQRIESDYVVCDEKGDRLRGGAISHRWMRMLQRVGIEHCRLHDARHSCASLMHARGVPIATVAAWLGHASSAFTLSTYVHSQTDALTAAAGSYRRTNE